MRAVMFVSRNKDNREVLNFKQRTRTFLVHEEDVQGDMKKLVADFNKFTDEGVQGEVSRMYISVNKRDMEATRKALLIHLIENEETDLSKIATLTTSIAMKHPAEKQWLFDFDNKIIADLDEFLQDVHDSGGEIRFYRSTLNGYAVVTKRGFDTRELLKKWGGCCELKKDAMLFQMGSIKC